MIWIILGIVFLLLTCWSMIGTTFTYYIGRKPQYTVRVRVWHLLILFIIYIIPIFGIIAFLTYVIWFIIWTCAKPHGYSCEYYLISLDNKNLLHRFLTSIINFFNHPLYGK